MARRSAPVVLLLLITSASSAQEFPRELTAWTELSSPRPSFGGAGGDAWDQKIRERGWILRVDGTYHLWYTGYNPARTPLHLLGHATSPDGLTWTRDPANPVHRTSWVEDMCVLRHEGIFVMFAEGEDDIAHELTSPDGVHWDDRGRLDVRKADGKPIEPGPYGTPTVLVEGGIWKLFYERNDQGIWLATSEDRKIWTNVQDEPVIPLGPEGSYDATAVALNQVFRRDGFYYGIYHANKHRPWGDWTTCLARSRDLIHWEKHAGNPIVGDDRSSGILVTAPDGGDRLYTMHPDVRAFGPRRE